MVKILLVDDSRVALMLEQRLLDREGVRLLTCTNGAEAVMVATEERPDLVIMDICMPCMNGIDATKHLRRRAATRHIPIILMSTNATPAQEAAYRSAGCDAFVPKPVDAKRLRDAVDQCLALGINMPNRHSGRHLRDEIGASLRGHRRSTALASGEG